MKISPASKSYSSFKRDLVNLLQIKDEYPLIEKICSISWEVSFMSKKQRITKILFFLEEISSDKTQKELQQYDIFELIISMSHFRRAKYKTETSFRT